VKVDGDEVFWPEEMFAFLGAFKKLRKSTTSFVMSVRPFARPPARMEQLVSHWTDFHEI
jgi:hypothetical protein